MKASYFVVRQNCDGEWSLCEYSTAEDLAEGECLNDDPDDYEEGAHPAESFGDHLDMETEGAVIIKGEIVLPRKKEVVTRWEAE